MIGDCVPRRTLLITLLAWSLAGFASGPPSPGYAAAGASQETALDEAFRSPPDEAKPWAYWWWLKGNVSEASIRRDLEAMKRMGFAGLLMFDARGYHEDHVPPPESRMDFMGPEWRRMLKFAISEADRLGLQISVNLSSCAGALKGPWLVGDDAPKQLLWTSLETRGGRTLRCRLPQPEAARSWGVALVAVRHAESNAAAAEEPATEKNASWGGWQTVQEEPDAKRLAAEVVDLSGKIDAQGQLAWDLPEGRWTFLRFASATMAGHEYDVDILDENAVAGHFQRIGKAIIDDAGPLAGKTLTHFYSVSWEGAIPTWTVGFDELFFRHRGYRIAPFLPVLAGIPVETPEVSARFLRDYDKVLGDCFRDHFYGKLKALSNREGIKWHSESGGPWNRNLSTFRHADQLAFLARNDMPQGEFWYPYRGLNKPPAMAAHIYGYVVVQMNCWNRVVQTMVASGMPVLYADFPYAGSGGFLVYTAGFLRRKAANFGFIGSSKFDDVVEAARCFLSIEKPDQFGAAVAKVRAARTRPAGSQESRPDDVACVSPSEWKEKMSRSKILTVGGEGWRGPKPVIEELGVQVTEIPYAEVNDAWKAADKDQARQVADIWRKRARSIAGVSRETLEASAAMYLAQKAVLQKHGADAITINCLGGFYGGHIHAYPCLGFHELCNEGLVGACENDLVSAATMVALKNLTGGRTGFISDPVIDIANRQIIYAHCVAPNRAFGPEGEENPIEILTHSEDRQGASLRSLLPLGYMTTTIELAAFCKELLFHRGKAVANVIEDRACRTKLAAEPDGDLEKLYTEWDRFGWHRVTVYGDLKEPLFEIAKMLKWKITEEA
ncbi:MAG: glycosyl hydrolase [Pirellulales bacterium]|jgi:hypothetical protein|nr:glycosyl hydrolase [Thermoguttaceae bacterium]MDD4788346.1 glycosyl hydrolase [Pirellulales bacterium]NLZ01617.1 hypothetical protein [Pirellulaceae bacterium]